MAKGEARGEGRQPGDTKGRAGALEQDARPFRGPWNRAWPLEGD